ncbi:hypothetical protein JOM56_004935 [Amanita muscaria]
MAATHYMIPVLLTEQHKKREKIDNGLATILECLITRAATMAPLVQSAFSSAARIFEISQKVRVNQNKFVQFAEEGCRLVYTISLKLEDKQEIEPKLKANVEELRDTLQSIQTFGEKCAARSTIKAVSLHVFDIIEINAQRRKMGRCMRLFGFQSLPDLREKTNQLIEQHRKNGENKIFGNNANFRGANGNVMGLGNVVNHNSENTNNRLNNSISFGSDANFPNAVGNAFGAGNEIDVDSDNRTGNLFGSDNAANDSASYYKFKPRNGPKDTSESPWGFLGKAWHMLGQN